ncbi:putative nuclease HARBI1 [Photinus pyralis]|uniref:putative nuclease HARBI1 n=1 Tax=Photinus pyralis TaxID=7054 RepID=UPI001267787D|nr:putative nuclease HARBI1 [Photinus pyralis]
MEMEDANVVNIILNNLENAYDESSSSDEDDELLIRLVKYKIPKIEHFIDDVVNKLNDCLFKSHFRMNRSSTNKLVEKFGSSSFYPKSVAGQKSVSSENHILSFLWFAGNKCCLRDVSQRFGVGIASLHRQCDRVMEFLVSIAPQIITFPTGDLQKLSMAKEFEKVSLPVFLNYCTDIPIRTPVHKIKSTYVNRHDIPSIKLQAVCDYKRRFMHILSGAPGKIHDARLLKLSKIRDKLEVLCGHDYHILGDSAYALRTWLLTPFREYDLHDNRNKNYNKKFSATRVLIENAFGIMKNRFQQLQCVQIHTVNRITKFITACCVLHNLCIEWNDNLEMEHFEIDDFAAHNEETEDNDTKLRRCGERKRNYIKGIL